MEQRRVVAYILIGLGAVALLARLSNDASWLWIGLLAAAALYAYSRQRTYGFLVIGCILAGTAAGILFQMSLRVDGVFLVSLGAGVFAIDVIERRPNRWPRILGAVLMVLGIVIALSEGGAFGSVWFALLLIAIGIALIYRAPMRSFAGRWTSEAAPPEAGAPLEGTTSTGPPPAAPPPAGPPTSSAGGQDAPHPPAPAGARPSPATDDRRRRLEVWRARTAQAEGKAPMAVLADDVLDAVAHRAPNDLAELAEVRGMGPVRVERYGAEMLAAMAGGE